MSSPLVLNVLLLHFLQLLRHPTGIMLDTPDGHTSYVHLSLMTMAAVNTAISRKDHGWLWQVYCVIQLPLTS